VRPLPITAGRVAALVEGPEVHIICSNASKTIELLILGKGDGLGKITPVKQSTRHFVIKSESTKGKPIYTEYQNESGTSIKVQSLIKFGETGTFEESGGTGEARLEATVSTELLEN
jgi:hypothetical protein